MNSEREIHSILAEKVGHLRANELVAELRTDIVDQTTTKVVGDVLDNLGEHLIKRYDGSTSKALAALDVAIWGIERG